MMNSKCILTFTLVSTLLIGSSFENSPQGVTNINHEVSLISLDGICLPPFCRKDKTIEMEDK